MHRAHLDETRLQVEHGAEGIIAYAVNPGTVFTDMAKVLPPEVHRFITDTPELPADTIAFLTRERRGWLAGRYISCESYRSSYIYMHEKELIILRYRHLGYGGADVAPGRDCAEG